MNIGSDRGENAMPGPSVNIHNIESEIEHFVENFKQNCPDWNEHFDRVVTTDLASPPDYLMFTRSISSYSKHSTTSTLPSSTSSNSIRSQSSISLISQDSSSNPHTSGNSSVDDDKSDRLSRIFLFDSQLFEQPDGTNSDGASSQSGKNMCVCSRCDMCIYIHMCLDS